MTPEERDTYRQWELDSRETGAALRRASGVDDPACWSWQITDRDRTDVADNGVRGLRRWQAGRCGICGFRSILIEDGDTQQRLVRGYVCESCRPSSGLPYALPKTKAWLNRPAAALFGAAIPYEGREAPTPWREQARTTPAPERALADIGPFRSEAELAQSVLNELRPWFDVETEVRGTHCTGRSMRLDAVLKPRDSSGWTDDHPSFGIEFKLAGNGDLQDFGTQDFTKWMAQTVDYTHVDWQGYGHLRIFSCPSPLTALPSPSGRGDSIAAISHFLWQLNVGELVKTKRWGWALIAQQDHVLWSEAHGVHQARKWSIRPRFGSR
jgi:hypothetical protein